MEHNNGKLVGIVRHEVGNRPKKEFIDTPLAMTGHDEHGRIDILGLGVAEWAKSLVIQLDTYQNFTAYIQNAIISSVSSGDLVLDRGSLFRRSKTRHSL